MSDLPKRKALRLKGYDYSSDGAYFLTICTKDRKCLLSEIAADNDGASIVRLTAYGKVAESYLKSIAGIDKYVIMPNHIHMILRKTNGTRVGNDVRSFKTLVSKRIGDKIWQDSYYDHIIRDEEDYLLKAKYIEDNPARWHEDEYSEGI